MRVLVIGKPLITSTIILDNFINEGTKTIINERHDEVAGNSVYIAKMLNNWGLEVYYAGAICGDEQGLKIKDELEKENINTTYIETDYERHSSINYILLNKKTGISTQILLDNEAYLTKHRYDINPEFIVTDGTDMGAAIAAANNYPRAKIILLANKVNNDFYNLSKRCHYVCASSSFASALTKMPIDFKPKALVDLYQKIKDLNKASYIVMLKEKGVLYAKDLNVKQIPGINVQIIDDTYSGSAFFSAYAYGILNNMDIDDIAKIANIAGGISLKEIGIKSIPTKEEVFKLAGIKLNISDNLEKLDLNDNQENNTEGTTNE